MKLAMRSSRPRQPKRQRLPLAFVEPTTESIEQTIREHIEHSGQAPSWGAIARALNVDEEAIRLPLARLLAEQRVICEHEGYNLACRLDTFDRVIREFISNFPGRITPEELRERLKQLAATAGGAVPRRVN